MNAAGAAHPSSRGRGLGKRINHGNTPEHAGERKRRGEERNPAGIEDGGKELTTETRRARRREEIEVLLEIVWVVCRSPVPGNPSFLRPERTFLGAKNLSRCTAE
jgi:hypothetical protein